MESPEMSDPARNDLASERSERWLSLDEAHTEAPARLLPWLSEPGLLTARVRAVAGTAAGFRLLKLALAPIAPETRARMRIADRTGLQRERLEYLALPRGHALDVAGRANTGADAGDSRIAWARRAVYRLGQHRIFVTEVFLAALQDSRL
jgi:chorismate-pyruvate lyase